MVRSKDGTSIAVWRQGRGPPLVMVHGMTGEHATSFRSLAPLLAESFTVHGMDRRGRGASGDAPAYAVEREQEDVAAVVDSIAGLQPVDVFGHSYGAFVALGASQHTKNIRRLVVYEPSATLGWTQFPEGCRLRIQAHLDRGDREAALITLFKEAVGASDEDIRSMQAHPGWSKRVAAAHTIPREMDACGDHAFDARRLRGLRPRTLLLVGSKSLRSDQMDTERVHSCLPESRVVVLQGQGHMATMDAPRLVADEVKRFLSGP